MVLGIGVLGGCGALYGVFRRWRCWVSGLGVTGLTRACSVVFWGCVFVVIFGYIELYSLL